MNSLSSWMAFVAMLSMQMAASALPTLEGDIQNKGNAIRLYQAEIQQQSQRIDRIKMELSRLEKSLGKKNAAYIEGVQVTRRLGDEISSLETEMAQRESDIQKSEADAKHLLHRYLVDSLDDHEWTPEHLAQQRVVRQGMNRTIMALQEKATENRKLDDRLKVLRDRFTEYRKTEKDMRDIVADLELRKRDLAIDYNTSLSQIRANQSKVEAMQSAARRAPVPAKRPPPLIASPEVAAVPAKTPPPAGTLPIRRFLPPLPAFTAMKHGNTGVTFEYKGRLPLRSPGKGKVVYSGELASYGNLIMIDHGQDVRTVMLGQFSTTVKKDDAVEAGDVLGQTSVASKMGNLYFEVRRKNVAQNTYPLLDSMNLGGKQ